MNAVILCGVREVIEPETQQRIPKALMQVGGRPLLWHVIKSFAAAGSVPSSRKTSLPRSVVPALGRLAAERNIIADIGEVFAARRVLEGGLPARFSPVNCSKRSASE